MSQQDETLPVRLVKVPAAAQSLGISRSQLYALLSEGKNRSVHIGRARRIPVAALDEYVSALSDKLDYKVQNGGPQPNGEFDQTPEGGADRFGAAPPRASRATSAGRPGTAAAA